MRDLTVDTPRLDADLLHALRRSRARRAVLRHLVQRDADIPARIARATGLDDVATLGALRGLGTRYAAARSLVGLGLVRVQPSPGHERRYATTPAGEEAWRRFQRDARA